MKYHFHLYWLFLVIFSFSAFAQTTTVYVDPVNGNDSNTGTIEKPFKTISKGVNALVPGNMLYLRGGNYLNPSKISLTKAASSGSYTKIWAYPGEKPVIDFTGNGTSDGFSISGSYYHLKGIEVKNAGHNGINISGNNNIVESCIVHDNKNTGLHLTGSSAPGPSNNIILNCDAYANFDPPAGGNADGFSAKWTVGPGNVFRGCRAYNNSDDGWDLWMATGSISIDSCVAFRNGVDIWHTGQVDGNGNGFKLGGNNVATPHMVKNCLAFDNAGNTGRGFDENNNLAGQTLYNCTSFRNKKGNYNFNNNPLTSGTHIIKNCISFRSGASDAIRNAVMEKNSWQGFTISDSDFVSIDTTGATDPRDTDGKLPKSLLLRLAPQSSMIDAGVDVGIFYSGKAPDLGAFESMKTTRVEINPPKPELFVLEQNYPNPFNPNTIINYHLPSNNFVTLKVFDLLGKEVATLVNTFQSAGNYKVEFNGISLQRYQQSASEVYIYRLTAGENSTSRKMLFLK